MSAKDQLESYDRRIAACAAACKGIPTEALEAGIVGEMMTALGDLLEAIELDPRTKRGDYYPWRKDARDLLAKAKAEGREGT